MIKKIFFRELFLSQTDLCLGRNEHFWLRKVVDLIVLIILGVITTIVAIEVLDEMVNFEQDFSLTSQSSID